MIDFDLDIKGGVPVIKAIRVWIYNNKINNSIVIIIQYIKPLPDSDGDIGGDMSGGNN